MHSIELLLYNLLCYGVLMNFITSRKKKQSLFTYIARKTITRPLKVSLYLTSEAIFCAAQLQCNLIHDRVCTRNFRSQEPTHIRAKSISIEIHIY